MKGDRTRKTLLRKIEYWESIIEGAQAQLGALRAMLRALDSERRER